MLRIEMRRAFAGSGFAAAMVACACFAMVHVCFEIAPMASALAARSSQGLPFGSVPPSAFIWWIGGSADVYSSVAFTVIPLIAAWPFASSLYRDMKTGYAESLITRMSRSRYYVAKVAAVFCSGAVSGVALLLVDLLAVALFLPLAQPVSFMSEVSPLDSTSMWAEVYFSNVWVYVGIFLAVDFVASGLIACLALPLSFVLSSGVLVAVSPFLMCLLVAQVVKGSDLAGFAPWNFMCPAQVVVFDPMLAGLFMAACCAGVVIAAVAALRHDYC